MYGERSALTAFLEYALSSASVRASTKSRRRLGRFALEDSIRLMMKMVEKEQRREERRREDNVNLPFEFEILVRVVVSGPSDMELLLRRPLFPSPF